MKRLTYILVALAALCLTSCKTNNWIDWKAQNELYMLSNGERAEVVTTPSGLQYTIIYEGNTTDARPNSTSSVVCDYSVKLINGMVIETTNNAYLSLSGLIPGFVEGIKKIHVQGDIILYIPWNLGYGEKGAGTEGYETFIPPYSTLIYTIHLTALTNY